METSNQQQVLTVYGTPVCPMVPPVRDTLKRAHVPYTYIDISRDPDAKEIVRDINNGNESVPTLVFPNGETMTEPSRQALRKRLELDGYTVDNQTPLNWLRVKLQNPITVSWAVMLFGGGAIAESMLMMGAGVVVLAVFLGARILDALGMIRLHD